MQGVIETGARGDALDQAFDGFAQAVGPGPIGGGFLEELPGADGVVPELVAVGVPVVAEHLEGSVGAIDFEGGRPVLLEGEAGGDDGGGTGAEVEDELGVVFGFDADEASVDVAFGDGDAGEGEYASGGADEPGEGGDGVDAEVEETAAAGAVEPIVPPGAGPSVASAGGADFADVTVADPAGEDLEGGAEGGEGCGDQGSGAGPGEFDELTGFGEVGGEWFFDDHVFIGLEGEAGEAAVIGHGGEDEHEVDVVAVEDAGFVGAEGDRTEELGGGGALRFATADGGEGDETAQAEAVEDIAITGEDVAGSDDSEAERGEGGHGGGDWWGKRGRTQA